LEDFGRRPPAQSFARKRAEMQVKRGRPAVSLLELVREGRFDANSKRHRRKLLEDDSLLEFVAGTEDAPATLIELAELQVRYRCERSAWAARAFQRLVAASRGDPLEDWLVTL
jgi:hypothetical protein